MRSLGTALLFMSSLAIGCSGGDDGLDAGKPVRDSGVPERDAGPLTRDAGDNPRDGGETPRDGGPDPRDAGPRDGGMPLTPELMPGAYIQVEEGRVTIGTDTLTDLQARFGPGTRSTTANARSYEWSLSNAVTLTVWFANIGIGPVGTIGADATALWASVQGGFAGTTPEGIGLTSTRTEVETAFGAAPHEVPITLTPTGTLLQYFTTGLLVAVGDDDVTRTITIHRAYPVEPNGEIDPASVRIRLSTGDVEGFGGLGNQGTRISQIRQRLGEPDAEGDVQVSGQDLHTLSYAFVGIEVFQIDNGIVGADRVAFINVHAPYYGVTNPGSYSVGSTRAEIEGFLSGEGFNNGTVSSTANFFCYTHPSEQSVGVSYSTDTPPVMTSMTIPLLMCP